MKIKSSFIATPVPVSRPPTTVLVHLPASHSNLISSSSGQNKFFDFDIILIDREQFDDISDDLKPVLYSLTTKAVRGNCFLFSMLRE